MSTVISSLEPIKIEGYGWRQSNPDHRDLSWSSEGLIRLGDISDPIDLRQSPFMPEVFDQLSLGSCVENSTAAAAQFDALKQGLTWAKIIPSRLFLYYNTRVIENTVSYDAGSQIRDAYASMNAVGICGEDIWPYDISTFTQQPPKTAYDIAATRKSVQYRAVNQTLDDLRLCLGAGWPVSFGFSVPSSFELPNMARTGVMEIPQPGESILGGHAVLLVGLSIAEGIAWARNSWSKLWGQSGYFSLPLPFLLDSKWCSDFWQVSLMTTS